MKKRGMSIKNNTDNTIIVSKKRVSIDGTDVPVLVIINKANHALAETISFKRAGSRKIGENEHFYLFIKIERSKTGRMSRKKFAKALSFGMRIAEINEEDNGIKMLK